MKTLHFSILILIGILFPTIILFVPQTAFGIQQSRDPTLEDQIGNSTQTKLVHDDSILILNQTTPKLVYKMGENITISTELINIGNKAVSVAYEEPEFFLELKNMAGDLVWPSHARVGWIPEFGGEKTLKPGEHFSAQPWKITPGWNYPPPLRLYAPGNYTVLSVGLFTFNTTYNVTVYAPFSVWSKPLQITVLPEKYVENETNSSIPKIPEFPFAIPIFIIGISSLILFYRMKFR
ncbi:MAG: hypothetical protein ACYDAJ_11435 [Nitrosotalea sp.]